MSKTSRQRDLMRTASGNLLEPVSDRRGAPRSHLRYLSQTIHLEEAGPPRLLLAAILAVVLLIGGAIGWAAITPVTTAARAVGTVEPSGPVQQVQHLEGGIVRELLVRDGDHVAEGELLIRLDGVASGADLRQLETRRLFLAARAMRLRSEIQGRTNDFDVIRAANPVLADDQARLLRTSLANRADEEAILRDRLRQRELETDALRAQVRSLEDQVAAIRNQSEIRENLFEKGVGSRIAMLEVQREAARLVGALGEARVGLRQAESAVVEARSQLREHASRWHAAREQELEDVTLELGEVDNSLARYHDRVERLEVLAPRSGVVNALNVSGPGSVIAPGEVLLEIVPSGEPMLVAATIDPRDIGYLRVGLGAEIAIGGFDVSRYGTVPGQLEWVSANSFTDDEGQIFYQARIAFASEEVGPEYDRRRIVPGMTAEANINTGNRSLLSFMIRPVAASLHQAFAER